MVRFWQRASMGRLVLMRNRVRSYKCEDEGEDRDRIRSWVNGE
jgi:hypothetical protein